MIRKAKTSSFELSEMTADHGLPMYLGYKLYQMLKYVGSRKYWR